jgi:pantoate--beta-alanine ligase
MRRLINEQPLAAIDYISVADAENLSELEIITGATLFSLAVRIGKTRLIDNVII